MKRCAGGVALCAPAIVPSATSVQSDTVAPATIKVSRLMLVWFISDARRAVILPVAGGRTGTGCRRP